MTQHPDLPSTTSLVYVEDTVPGIRRKRAGKGWGYYDPAGKRITDPAEILRLNRIGLPPAYVNCWFCPDPNGHIQAVGFDARGRKQYRYHASFREARDARKYGRCLSFGEALPKLRKQVETDLRKRKPDKAAVVAAVVRLLDLGKIRIGNENYRKLNRSYGATTLRRRHARVAAGKVRLEYRGKSGKLHQVTVADRGLARLVKRCQDIPGQTLFKFLDEDGVRHPVTSSDVNAYIRDATGSDFTAKDFRTWGASVIAYQAIVEESDRGLTLKSVLERVSRTLGNTPAIARKSYIHPYLIEIAKPGAGIGKHHLPRATRHLSRYERGLMAFLQKADTVSKAA